MYRFLSAVWLLCLVPAHAVSLNEVVYLGCYSSEFVKSNPYYKVQQALSWDKGMVVCVDRLTMFVGVQVEPGSSDDYIFFCGNDLVDHSLQVTSSVCSRCGHDSARYCGGPEAVALYKLRDSTPLAIMLATSSSGVRMLTDDSSAAMTKVQFSNSITHVDYFYTEDEIFFSYSTYVYRSFYNYFSSVQNTPSYIRSSGYSVAGISMDWITRKVYWIMNSHDIIYNMDLDGSNLAETADRSSSLTGLTIDPYSRILFFAEAGLLFSLNLTTSASPPPDSRKVNGKLYVSDIKALAVDHHEQFIYMIGHIADDTSRYYMVRTDYMDSRSKVLLNGTHLTDPRALDVFNGVAVWVNYASSQYSVYKCKLTPKCNETDMKLIYQSSESIRDARIYHPERQTPGKKFLCDNSNCSHSCDHVSLFAVTCSCPSGTVLGRDNKTCEDENSATSVPPSTKRQEALFSIQHYTLAPETMEHYSERVTLLLKKLNKIEHLMTTTEDTRQESNNKISVVTDESSNGLIVNMFDIFQTIILLLILVSLLILFLKARKGYVDKDVGLNRPMELKERSNCNIYENPDSNRRRLV